MHLSKSRSTLAKLLLSSTPAYSKLCTFTNYEFKFRGAAVYELVRFSPDRADNFGVRVKANFLLTGCCNHLINFDCATSNTPQADNSTKYITEPYAVYTSLVYFLQATMLTNNSETPNIHWCTFPKALTPLATSIGTWRKEAYSSEH